MTVSTSLPPKPSGKQPKPPKHLEPTEVKLWRALVDAHDFGDAASLALLETAMESHQRGRRCREAIDKDGETVPDRFGQLKPHPLLPSERDARAAFLTAMRALNLDLTGGNS